MTAIPTNRPAGPQRRRWWPATTGGGLVALLSLLHLYSDALTSMLTALLPSLQDRFGLNATQLATLVAVSSLTSNASQPLLGGLADRFGAGRVAAIGALAGAALLSLMPIASTPALLGVVLVLGGLGVAAFHPAAAALARAVGGARSDFAVSIFSAAGTIGIALGPVLLIAVIASYGIDRTPWMAAPVAALAFALLILTSGARRPTGNRPRGLRALNLGLLRGPIGWLALAAILASTAAMGFTNGLVLWLSNEQGRAADDTAIGWTVASFSLASAGGGIVASLLTRRLPRAWLAAGTLALAVVPFNLALHTSPGTVAYYALVAAAGALSQASYPILIVSAQHLAIYAAATAASLVMGFATGVAGITYIAVGGLQDLIGFEPAIRVISLILLPAAWITLVMLRRHFHGPDASRLGQTICACATCRCSGCPRALPSALSPAPPTAASTRVGPSAE